MRYAKLITIVLLGMVLVTGFACGRYHQYGPCGNAHHADKEQIEAAVAEYMKSSGGDVPVVNKTAIAVNASTSECYEIFPDKDYHVIAIYPLLTCSSHGGILKRMPYTAHSKNCILEGANVEVNVAACDCADVHGHYVWLATKDGDIASICIGEDCTVNGEDGFQDVYP